MLADYPHDSTKFLCGDGTWKVVNVSIPANYIVWYHIADNAITTTKIQDESITTNKIQDNTITTFKIRDNTITNNKIQNQTIKPDKLNFYDINYNINIIEFKINFVLIKMQNGVLYWDFCQSIQPSLITDYPNDSTTFLCGDGTWKVVKTESQISEISKINKTVNTFYNELYINNDIDNNLVLGVIQKQNNENLFSEDMIIFKQNMIYMKKQLNCSQNIYAMDTSLMSDRRLKKNIKPIINSRKFVKNLKPVRYKWKHNNKNDIGFIAQDIYKLDKSLVDTIKFNNKNIKTIKYHKIIPHLVNVIQYQQKQINTLFKKIKNIH